MVAIEHCQHRTVRFQCMKVQRIHSKFKSNQKMFHSVLQHCTLDYNKTRMKFTKHNSHRQKLIIITAIGRQALKTI